MQKYLELAVATDSLNAKLSINITTGLTVLCWIFLLVFLISRFSGKMKIYFDNLVRPKANLLLWLIPTVATAFSLYFSEVLGWIPCKLCWAQRACMYPLALFMILNALKPNAMLKVFAFFLSSIGAMIAIYHCVIEKYPNLESSSCDPAVPCSNPPFQSIGFIKIGDYSQGLLTIAGMAFTAFISVLVILFISRKKKEIANG